ncbi:S9 family peptidase [Sphingosinithalassobacter tenebrarum]|uniref:S9 family peptidase n=2 Tax=Stakelama tenebrarum TaxID=2711215 RepID=A0A6G6YB47_9SPHN|nr:S9 family peptidase [Sphingosinithalassobacter tenebrarum]
MLTMGCAALALMAAAPAPRDGAAPAAASAQAEDPDLIPRDLLFGNPKQAQGRISPDGKYISWLAPVDGVLNVFVAPADDPSAARAVTNETVRSISAHYWTPGGGHILYPQDSGGNENFHIHSVDVETGADIDLTPVDDSVRATIESVSKARPGAILIGLNDRNPQLFDLYEVDLTTGERTLVLENPGFGQWVIDNDLKPRFAIRQMPGGGSALFRPDDAGEWQPVAEIDADSFFNTAPLGFNRANDTLYWVDSRGRDKAALVAMDADTLETSVIAESDKADIQNAVLDPVTYEPIAYGVNYLKNEWTPLTEDAAADLDFLKARLSGEISFVATTDDGTKSVVVASSAQAPSVYYVYDRAAQSLTRMFESRPELEAYALQPMHPVVIPASDGEELVSYLTLPAGADADGDGTPEKAMPLVLFVHGGPWARDSYGYSSAHQWLANRGYAVLSVNFRGSTGFGKEFVNIAAGEWSGAMHQDLIDAVDWAIEGGVTTPDEVAIMGGSYGGYATLVGLTFTPDRFACGVDIVGPSNLATLMKSFPPYWRPLLEGTFFKHIGDPDDPADLEEMMAQSPISRVDAITKPLLIGQGANDPRVAQAESDQIVEAMKEKDLPVTYLLYPDEGHGFARSENSLSFFGVAEGFLSQCLGGEYQPIGDDFEGSSIQVVEGAEYVPGLPEAVAAHAANTAEE